MSSHHSKSLGRRAGRKMRSQADLDSVEVSRPALVAKTASSPGLAAAAMAGGGAESTAAATSATLQRESPVQLVGNVPVDKTELEDLIATASAEALRRCVRLLVNTSPLPPDLIRLTLAPTASDLEPARRAESREKKEKHLPIKKKRGAGSTSTMALPQVSTQAQGGADLPSTSPPVDRRSFMRRSNSYRMPSSAGGIVGANAGTASMGSSKKEVAALPAISDRLAEGSIEFRVGSKWKKRLIVADADNLFIAKKKESTGDVQKVALFCASVRGDKKEFSLLSPAVTLRFRCHDAEEASDYARMLSEICQNLIHKSIGSKTKDFESTGRARAVSTVDSPAVRRLKAVRLAKEENGTCADCSRQDPDWVSINLGAWLCSECAGGHRNLGSHISQVRSVQYDDLEQDKIDFMASTGNATVNEFFEHLLRIKPNMLETIKPNPSTSVELKQAFVRAKYADQAWVNESAATEFLPTVGQPASAVEPLHLSPKKPGRRKRGKKPLGDKSDSVKDVNKSQEIHTDDDSFGLSEKERRHAKHRRQKSAAAGFDTDGT